MAGREEQKRRDWHVERAIAATKRDLAEKVRNTVQLFMPPITAEYSNDDRPLARTLTAVIAELDRVFTESGVRGTQPIPRCAECGHTFLFRFDGVCAVLVPKEDNPTQFRQCEHRCLALAEAAQRALNDGDNNDRAKE